MKKLALAALAALILAVVGGVTFVHAQFGIDNQGANISGHLDIPASGTCTAGPANFFRLCGNSNALQVSANGASPVTLVSSAGLPDTVQTIVPITLTNAQVLAMSATPILIVPAQGPNTIVEIVTANVENLNTGVAYANGGIIGLFYTTTISAANEGSTTLAATFLTTPTVTTDGILTGAGAALVGSTSLNAGVYISNLTAPFITGTGTLKVQVSYRVRSGL